MIFLVSRLYDVVMKDRERIRQAETETEMNRQTTEEKGQRG